MRARFVVALFGLAWLAGCASASPVPTATGDGEPIPPAACPTISLRSPAGEIINLTGRWRSPDGGTYYIRQSGSCVWIVGINADAGVPGGTGTEDWTNSFFGFIASDFSVRGSWADVPWGRDTGVGELAWRIHFDDVDGEEGVTLQVTEVTGGFGADFLLRPESEADLRVRLQDNDECLSVVTDTGEVRELVTLPPGWSWGVPPRLLGPDQEEILPSDDFDLSGEVAHGSGRCSTGLIMFADTVTPIAAP